MLRYIFILLPLLTAGFVWLWNYHDLNSDYIIPSIIVCICTIGWIKFNSFTRFRKLLVIYLSASWLNELVSYYSGLWFQVNSPIYHVFSWIQLILIGLIFSETLAIGKHKNLFWSLISAILILDICNCTVFGSIFTFPSLNLVILAALVLTLTLFQFRQMILHPSDTKLENQPLFWFNLSTFIFFAFSFFMFGFLSTTPELPNWMYLILEGMNIYLYLHYFIAIILDATPKKLTNDSIS